MVSFVRVGYLCFTMDGSWRVRDMAADGPGVCCDEVELHRSPFKCLVGQLCFTREGS